MIALPAVVRAKARALGVTAWIEELPALVRSLERDWSIAVGPVVEGATEAFVALAVMADGTDAVLKMPVPRPGAHLRNEITVLAMTGGEGCARLLRHDTARGALLLERLGRSLSECGLPTRRRLEILCDTAERIWRPAAGCGLPTGAEKGRRLIDFITATWAELDRPCSEAAVSYALACATRRIAAHDDERSVLVHGDIHQWNALEAGHGFRLVDPDGLLAEAEYDLGVLMREDPLELLHGDPWCRARWLGRRCGLDATAIWEWGVVERVSTGLLGTRDGLQPVSRQMLTVAERVAGAAPGA